GEEPPQAGYRLRVDPGEQVLLRWAGFDPDDSRALAREFSRIRRERELRQVFTGPADLQAAREAAAAARTAERREVPALEAAREEIAAKIARLTGDREAAEERARSMNEARHALATLAPKFIRDAGEKRAAQATRAAAEAQRAAAPPSQLPAGMLAAGAAGASEPADRFQLSPDHQARLGAALQAGGENARLDREGENLSPVERENAALLRAFADRGLGCLADDAGETPGDAVEWVDVENPPAPRR
ncbi:MAG TPA: hypothetical protein PKE47_13580, partial [Verrucomicrobiota bacterium]|nr:hypothetical protein [Verrucomicrobiota bacterium]